MESEYSLAGEQKGPLVSERASKAIFLLEFLVFALPAILILGFYSVLIGGWTLFGLGTALILPFTEIIALAIRDFGDLFAVSAMVVAVFLLAASGAIALWKFAAVARIFWKKGATALHAARETFNRGLAFAILPLCVMLPFGVLIARSGDPGDVISAFYLSGVSLIVPVLHLWLELRYRPSAP